MSNLNGVAGVGETVRVPPRARSVCASSLADREETGALMRGAQQIRLAGELLHDFADTPRYLQLGLEIGDLRLELYSVRPRCEL